MMSPALKILYQFSETFAGSATSILTLKKVFMMHRPRGQATWSVCIQRGLWDSLSSGSKGKTCAKIGEHSCSTVTRSGTDPAAMLVVLKATIVGFIMRTGK
jgi:hypothetical protein